MENLDKHLSNLHTAQSKPTMEKFIEYLYSINYCFIEHSSIQELCELPDLAKFKNYSFLIRRYHIDTNPLKDLFDTRLVMAFDLHFKSPRLFVWLGGDKYRVITKNWNDLGVNFKERKIKTKYPDAMSIQDRIDYRRIESKMKGRGPTDEERDFYNKWVEAVEKINDRSGIIDEN